MTSPMQRRWLRRGPRDQRSSIQQWIEWIYLTIVKHTVYVTQIDDRRYSHSSHSFYVTRRALLRVPSCYLCNRIPVGVQAIRTMSVTHRVYTMRLY